MATRATESESSGKRLIATYLPGGGSSHFIREITKKQAKDGLLVDLDEDLVWSAETQHRADVTDAPEALIEYLKKDPAFKVAEE